MSIWKLVSGILSIVFSVFIVFQSCAAGIVNTIRRNGEISGTAGLIVAMFMLSGGIVSIASRKGTKNGGNIALIILYSIAALVGFTMFGSYIDLAIWSCWCAVMMIMAIIAIVVSPVDKPQRVQLPTAKQ